MIFGEKFYPKLKKLSPWRQSLFALVLAHRQFPNFASYCLACEKKGKSEFNFALKKLWEFHQEKFNHIDLEECLAVFEPFVPDVTDDSLLGEFFALDASACLVAAYDAIIMHEGNEAEIASRSSLASVVRIVENAVQEGQMELDLDNDDEIREVDIVDLEVNYQVALFELLQGAKRDKDLILSLLKIADNNGISNIGIDGRELDCGSYKQYTTK